MAHDDHAAPVTLESLESRTLLAADPISFSAGHPAKFIDQDGDAVTITLSGPGTGSIAFTDAGDAEQIVLDGTTAKSSVKVSVKGIHKATSVQTITVNGELKSFSGAAMALDGSFAASGAVGSITLGDIADQHTMNLHTGLGATTIKSTALTLGAVTDLSVNTNGIAISSLKVASWTDAGAENDTITAPWIGKITSAGAFEADLVLSGNADARKATLGSAKIAGNLEDATWDVGGFVGSVTVKGGANNAALRSDGNINSVNVGYSNSSSFLAGIADGLNAPEKLSHFASSATIKSFKVTNVARGQAAPALLFQDSTLAAASIGSVKLINVDPTNTSISARGVAGTGIRSVAVFDTVTRKTVKYPVKNQAFAAVPLNFISSENRSPLARAGADQTVTEGALVRLDGSASSDADGDLLTYEWQQIGGTAVVLAGADTANPTFTAPATAVDAVLSFLLTVNDGSAASTDVVVVYNQHQNVAPTVNAGTDRSVNEQTLTTLTATANDPEHAAMTYLWQQISGPAVVISNATALTCSFTTPATPNVETLVFQFTATDVKGLATSDTVTVTVNHVNVAPAANAGADQTVNEGTLVTLDGSASSDPEGAVTYLWERVSGPAIVINNPTAAVATFTAPATMASATIVLRLTVTDLGGLSRTDNVQVVVNHVNVAPSMASATAAAVDPSTNVAYSLNHRTVNGDGYAAPLNVYEGRSFLLSATATDTEAGALSYTWTQISGKPVTIANANTANARVTLGTIARDGTGNVTETAAQNTLVFRCTVTDAGGLTTTRDVTVRVRLLGDVNLDDVVDSGAGGADWLLLTDALANESVETERYDINGNGMVDFADITAALNNISDHPV